MNSEIVAALCGLAVDENMQGMERAMLLETCNTTDRSEKRCTFNDSSKTKAMFIDLDEETSDNDGCLSEHGSLPDILENRHSLLNKGKEILDYSEAQNVQLKKVEPHLEREWLKVWQGVSLVTTRSDDTLGSARVGDEVPMDPKEKAFANSFYQGACDHSGEETNPLLDPSHENAVGGESVVLPNNPEIFLSQHGSNASMVYTTPESDPKHRRNHRRRKHKAKRKHSLLQKQLSERSSSSLEVPEISCLQSSNEALKLKIARQHSTECSGESSQPVLEVDKAIFSSNFQEENSIDYNDPSSKLNQLESDEKLARQLQQQYDHEQSGLDGTEEADADMAWSLQQEEASHAASAKRYRSHPRDASMAHLYGHGQRPSFQEYSEQLSNQLRNHVQASSSSRMTLFRRNFHLPEMNLQMSVLAELRRNINNGSTDPEMRVYIREALEATFGNDEEMELLDDTFEAEYDDDYEILSTLDNYNIIHSGASESQINSLPESVIQGNSREEACPICLESQNAGDVVRHLPCMHKFHKECIAAWLRRKISCPICKTGVF